MVSKIGEVDERGFKTIADYTDTSLKSVTIKFINTHDPEFDFSGEWTGHDIRAVMINLKRAYRKYQLDIRKSEQPTEVASTKE